MPNIMAEFFNESFALQYEAFSSRSPKPYEYVARALAKVDRARDGELALEVGSGTGNSTIVLLERLPELRGIVCIDPSRGTFQGVLRLAEYKFGKRDLVFPPESPPEALSYIERQRERATPFRDKVTILEGDARNLNMLGSDTFDRVYAPESFHWFAMETPTSKPDFDLLSNSVAEIARVLRPGGKFVFDSNGHLFRFGEEAINGRGLDDMHFTKHPFRDGFNRAFSAVATEVGFDIPVSGQEPSPLHYMFDQAKIRHVLEQNGLEIIPAPGQRDYSLRLLHMSLDSMIRASVTSAKMGHFKKPELVDLPEEEKDRWIKQAIELAVQENQGSSDRYYETYTLYIAQKRN